MVKKVLIIYIILWVNIFFNFKVFANIRIEQVHVNKPDISVYYYLDNFSDLNSIGITAYLSNEKLEVQNNRFYEEGEGTLYFFLIDVSTSISSSQMDNIKSSLAAFSDNMGNTDKITIISFGESVEVLVDGSDDKRFIKDHIDGLRNNQNETLFFDGLNKAIEISNISNAEVPMRKVAFIISDAEDFTMGGHTLDEITEKIRRSNLPLYAIALDSGKKQDIDLFGSLARVSGGSIVVTPEQEISRVLMEIHDSIKKSCVLKMRSSNNIVSSDMDKLKMTFLVDEKSFYVEKDILVNRWIPDNTIPYIDSVIQLTNDSIKVIFNEDVLDADNINNFYVTDEKKRRHIIKSAVYNVNDFSTILTFDQELYTEKISITCINIKDNSMEKNIVEQIYEFDMAVSLPDTNIDMVSDEAVENSDIKTSRFQIFIFIALLLILILIMIILITLTVRKRKISVIANDVAIKADTTNSTSAVEEKHNLITAPQVKYHFTSPKTVPLHIEITDMSGKTNKFTLDVNKSIVVGRSNVCDLYFDDVRMSRQHFIIEEHENEFYIGNLNNTNGTFVNGVRLKGKRKLVNGDVISAGQEKFTIRSG